MKLLADWLRRLAARLDPPRSDYVQFIESLKAEQEKESKESAAITADIRRVNIRSVK